MNVMKNALPDVTMKEERKGLNRAIALAIRIRQSTFAEVTSVLSLRHVSAPNYNNPISIVVLLLVFFELFKIGQTKS